MATLPEPQSHPVETTAATADPFYGSLVVIDDRQTFMIVVDGLQLDPAKVQEIESKLQGVVADALVEHALEVQPLNEARGLIPGGGLAGRQFAPGGLISELLPEVDNG